MKVEFTQDYVARKKGDVKDYRDSLAKHCINLGVAKIFTPKRQKKVEQGAEKRKTK